MAKCPPWACYNRLKHSQTSAYIHKIRFLKYLQYKASIIYNNWIVWHTIFSHFPKENDFRKYRLEQTCFNMRIFLNLNYLAAAENQGKHKAGKGKQVCCRYGALRLICGDEHGSLHARLTWVQSVVFGIHIAAIAKGEIAEAWPSLISTCKPTHTRMHAAAARIGMKTTSSPLTCSHKHEAQGSPF